MPHGLLCKNGTSYCEKIGISRMKNIVCMYAILQPYSQTQRITSGPKKSD